MLIQTTSSTPAGSTQTPPAGAANQQPVMTDEAFTRLVSGIGSMVSQTAMGQAPSGSISDFLSTIGEGYISGDGKNYSTHEQQR